MMISKEISASPDSAQWQSTNWKDVESHVLKLQMRIAKATREGKTQQSESVAVDTDSLAISKTSCC
ncbi:Uncharacterised protein [Vibrio anguillarum]|nr:Uncharacterised protein [Vibrio anguillarum]